MTHKCSLHATVFRHDLLPDQTHGGRACRFERSATIQEFCDTERISRSHFYKLLEQGQGPELTRSGKRVTVTPEAHRRWRLRHTAKSPRKSAPVIEPTAVMKSEDRESPTFQAHRRRRASDRASLPPNVGTHLPLEMAAARVRARAAAITERLDPPVRMEGPF